MSTSYNSGVVLGVKLPEIGFNIEKISTKFEIHDKRGNPTGKFEYETSFKFTYKGVEVPEEKLFNSDLYPDSIADFLKMKNPLKMFHVDYENDDDFIDNTIIGVSIVKNHYNEYHFMKEISFDDKIDLVKNELKSQFDVDVEPELYYYFEVSC